MVATLSGSGAPMAMLSACVPAAPLESVIWMVKLNVPCAVGVPEMVTEFVVLAPSESPGGSEPAEMDHANGPTPPAALTLLL